MQLAPDAQAALAPVSAEGCHLTLASVVRSPHDQHVVLVSLEDVDA